VQLNNDRYFITVSEIRWKTARSGSQVELTNLRIGNVRTPRPRNFSAATDRCAMSATRTMTEWGLSVNAGRNQEGMSNAIDPAGATMTERPRFECGGEFESGTLMRVTGFTNER
jgi:hypothetical protein